MTEKDLRISIQSSSDPVDEGTEGWDTSILAFEHERWYVSLEDGSRALLVPPLMMFLRGLFERQAAALGRRLHHADVVISGDREVVRQAALAHDCPSCQASCDQLMSRMDDNPGEEFIIGTLHWVALP